MSKLFRPFFFLFSLLITGGNAQARVEMATFAGGCFWCMESTFEKKNGVIEMIAGYMGGYNVKPTYEEVSSGATGHVEAI